MLNGYYSDYLFHFTGRNKSSEEGYSNLISILKHGLKVSLLSDQVNSKWCEKLKKAGYDCCLMKLATCFTDIPIDKISSHTSTYGEFGIGLSREWAIRNKAQPMVYVGETGFINGLIRVVNDINLSKAPNKNNNVFSDLRLDEITPYLKDIDCYHEREWRITFDSCEIADSVHYDDGRSEEYIYFNKNDLVLIVVPRDYLHKLNNDICTDEKLKKKYGQISFSVLVYEDLVKLFGK